MLCFKPTDYMISAYIEWNSRLVLVIELLLNLAGFESRKFRALVVPIVCMKANLFLEQSVPAFLLGELRRRQFYDQEAPVEVVEIRVGALLENLEPVLAPIENEQAVLWTVPEVAIPLELELASVEFAETSILAVLFCLAESQDDPLQLASFHSSIDSFDLPLNCSR